MAESEFNRRSLSAAGAAAVAYMVGPAAVLYSSFGLFMEQLNHAFGWSRLQISLAHTFLSYPMAIGFIFSGFFIDRFGARVFTLSTIGIFGCAVLALSLQNGSIALLYGIFTLIGLCRAAGGDLAITKVATSWFDRRRGVVLATIFFGYQFSSAVVPQYARFLIAHVGWRDAYIGLGLYVLVLGVPVLTLFFRESPAMIASRQMRRAGNEPAAGDIVGVSILDALHSIPFWLCFFGVLLTSIVNTSMGAHTVELMRDRGFPDTTAATVQTFIAIGGLCMQAFSGPLLDRINTPRVGIPILAVAWIGLMLMHHGGAVPLYILGAAMFGAGLTGEYTMLPYFLTRYFGLKSFGRIYGIVAAGIAFAAGSGPPMMGWIYGKTNSYEWGLRIDEIALTLVIVLTLLLPAYRFRAQTPGAKS